MTAIYRWEEIVPVYWNYCYGIRMPHTATQECSSQWNISQIQCLCHTLNSQHPTRALAASPRPVACLRCLNGTPQMRMTRGRRRGCFCLNPLADCQRQYFHRGTAQAISGRQSCGVFQAALMAARLKRSSIWLHSKQTGDAALSGWCHNLPLTIAWASANTDNLERVLVYFQ